MSLYHLLDQEVLANPYPLFHRLRSEAPVHWDPFLHAWVVTRYADVMEVLLTFSADRTPTPAQLDAMGLSSLNPIAELMVKLMLFMDAPGHTRLRALAAKAFTPARVEQLRGHIKDVVNSLLDGLEGKEEIDVIADLAEPLPAIVTAELLGVPTADAMQLKQWSANFAEMLGNFQHNPERVPLVLKTVNDMTAYFQNAVGEQREHPREGLIHSLLMAEVDGDRLTEDEVIASCIVTMVGGLETTTNLIGNGILTLLRYPAELEKLRGDLSLIPSAVEEMLRYESPSQHTARICPSDRQMGGKLIQKRQAVIAVMAAANRDPERFPDPDRFDITRKDNRHMAFGYAAHYCFGAPLARVEGQLALEGFLRRFANFSLPPQKLEWRTNLGLRGLKSLKVALSAQANGVEVSNRTSLSPAVAQREASSKNGESASNRKQLLEKYLSDRRKTGVKKAAAVIRHSLGTTAPVSPAQQELLRRELASPGVAPLYNECVTLRMLGPLDVPALEKSLNEIIKRHAIWSTSFEVNGDQATQIVRTAKAFSLPLVDLRNVDAEQREAEVRRRIGKLCREPFQLNAGPLLRPTLVRMSDDEHRLYLIAHLLVLDGMSAYQVFPSELAAVYKAYSNGTAPHMDDLGFQYADFANWEREHVGSDSATQLTYWGKQLSGTLIPIDLAGGKTREDPPKFRGEIYPFVLPKDLSDRIKSFSREENSTLFVTLLAGFAVLLQRYTKRSDIVVGTLSPCGREKNEFTGLLGYFLNPVALRLDLAKSATFEDLLVHARETLCAAIIHDDLPIEQLSKELANSTKSQHNPFFNVAVSLQPPTPELGLPWSVTTMDVNSGGSPWEFYIAFIDRAEGIMGRAQFNPDLFELSKVKEIVRDFQNILEQLVSNPGQNLDGTQPIESGVSEKALCPFAS